MPLQKLTLKKINNKNIHINYDKNNKITLAEIKCNYKQNEIAMNNIMRVYSLLNDNDRYIRLSIYY